jgi:hypothetical protein
MGAVMHGARRGRVSGWIATTAVVLAITGSSGGGCASSPKLNYTGDDGGGSSDGTASSSSGAGGDALFSDVNLDAPFNPDSGCATGNYHAQFQPAAMLVVLDASQTMAQNNKYATAQQAIVQAIDENAFDSAYLGLLTYPTGNVQGPACVFNFPVACAVPGLAQIPLQLAGTNKSTDPTGVRHDIYGQLASSSPSTSGVGEANPSYLALQNGISILQGWPQMGKRILFFITDGGASCASLSTRGGYLDGNGCMDWEFPSSIISLVQGANSDPNSPVNTIFVGVPGADTDTDGSNKNIPPYDVSLALSAEAWAGSPQTCDPNCNGKTFTQGAGAPSAPCHFDMTVNYSPQILAAAINQIRGSLLGCVFDVPQPDGGMINPNEVNVQYSTDGTTYTELYKRASPSETCMTGNGCWDYNASGQIVLIGPACNSVETAANGDVEIVVGCQTVTQ